MATVAPVSRLIASWFGTGLILRRVRGADEGSGTIGSIAALIPALLLQPAGWVVQLTVAAAVTAVSVIATKPFADEGDPGWVVVDEAAGTFIATIGLGWPGWLVAFVVFRIADIVKATPGVGRAEALPGGWGITFDDVVAGAYGLAAGWALQLLVG